MSLDIDPNHVFRDFTIDGMPASGKHDPKKVEIRQWTTGMWQAVIALVADADPNLALPNLLIRYSVTGGTANAIEAIPNLTPPAGAGLALFSIAVTSPNTGPVTINGRHLRTSSGSEISAGGLVAGVWLFLDGGNEFRLVSDQASAAIVAAAEAEVARAEAEADRAETAASAIASAPQYAFESKAGAELFDPPADPAFIMIDGRYRVRSSEKPPYGDGAQTGSGAWYGLRERSVYAEDFDALPGGVSPAQRSLNTLAFRKMLRHCAELGRVGLARGRYFEIDGPIMSCDTDTWSSFAQPDNEDIDLRLEFPNETEIKYVGGSNISHLIDIRLANLRSVVVEGLTLDGDDKVHTNMATVASGKDALLLAYRDCHSKNARVTDTLAITTAAHGLRLAADNPQNCDHQEMLRCSSDRVTKAPGRATAAAGIVMTNFRNFRCDYTRSRDVRHDGTNMLDADCFSIFSGADDFAYRESLGSFDHNEAINGQGRAFKFQVNGGITAKGNIIRLENAGQLITSWRGIDSQTGDILLEDTRLYSDALWTGGAEAIPMQLQMPVTPRRKRVHLQSHGFILETEKPFNRLWMPILRAIPAEAIIEVTGFTARGQGGPASTTISDMAASIWCVINGVSGLSAEHPIRIECRDNDYHTGNNFVLQQGSGAADLTDILHIDSVNDVSHPLSGNKPFWSPGSTMRTSSLLIAGLQCGDFARLDGILDWSKFKPGFDCYIGSGTMTNAAGQTFRAVSKTGQIMKTYTGSAIRVSSDNGATWSSNIT